jgi:hypothetical protein
MDKEMAMDIAHEILQYYITRRAIGHSSAQLGNPKEGTIYLFDTMNEASNLNIEMKNCQSLAKFNVRGLNVPLVVDHSAWVTILSYIFQELLERNYKIDFLKQKHEAEISKIRDIIKEYEENNI